MIETMLDVGPYYGSRSLRAHGKTSAFTIGEGVHLFRNDIRFFPNTPTEELGPFKKRGSKLPKTKSVEHFPGCLFKVLPTVDLSRKDIFKTLYCGEFQK